MENEVEITIIGDTHRVYLDLETGERRVGESLQAQQGNLVQMGSGSALPTSW
jgi:hypothetical protein